MAGYHYTQRYALNPYAAYQRAGQTQYEWGWKQNSQFAPLLKDTGEALESLSLGRVEDFMDEIRGSRAIIQDISDNINDGPVFTADMARRLIIGTCKDAIIPDANVASILMARDVFMHFIKNSNAEVHLGHSRNKRVTTSAEDVRNLYSVGSLRDIFRDLDGLMRIDGVDHIDAIAKTSAAMVLVVFGGVYQWATKVKKDNDEHVANIALLNSLVFSVLSTVLHLLPVPGPGAAADALISPISQAIQRQVSRSYEDSISFYLDAKLEGEFLAPARSGLR